MASFSQLFLRCANHWCGEAVFKADSLDRRRHLRIGNVGALPRHQKVHPVYGGNRDVGRIGGRLDGQGQRIHQRSY